MTRHSSKNIKELKKGGKEWKILQSISMMLLRNTFQIKTSDLKKTSDRAKLTHEVKESTRT
jgi:hypothetical protein